MKVTYHGLVTSCYPQQVSVTMRLVSRQRPGMTLLRSANMDDVDSRSDEGRNEAAGDRRC